MISRRGQEREERRKKGPNKKRGQEEFWWTERVERKHYYRLCLALSLLSHSKEGTQPGLD